MKKTLFLLAILSISTLWQVTNVYGQVTSTTMTPAPVQLDEKTQKKADKAKAELARDQKSLQKKEEAYNKEKTKMEKQNAKGKLSPVDIEKGEKSLARANKEIEKLKEKIDKNEKYLASLTIPTKTN